MVSLCQQLQVRDGVTYFTLTEEGGERGVEGGGEEGGLGACKKKRKGREFVEGSSLKKFRNLFSIIISYLNKIKYHPSKKRGFSYTVLASGIFTEAWRYCTHFTAFSFPVILYRFEGLIDREWLRGGHPFAERCVKVGLSTNRYKGQGPVFLLFLDCVWQVRVILL